MSEGGPALPTGKGNAHTIHENRANLFGMGRTFESLFEDWCNGVETGLPAHHIDYDKIKSKGAPQIVGFQIDSAFKQKVIKDVSVRKPNIHVHTVSNTPQKLGDVEIDLSEYFDHDKLEANTRSNIHTMRIKGAVGKLTMSGALIREVVLEGNRQELEFRNCYIARLHANGAIDHLRLRGCWIGQFRLEKGSIAELVVSGGSIRSVACPPPGGGNPFIGSVSIDPNVIFATQPTSKILESAQGYRNLRSHLEELHNVPASNIVRTIELRTERNFGEDRGFTRFVSWVYDTFALYGTNPGRPLAWMVSLYIVAVVFTLGFDGGTTGLEASAYSGWREGLTDAAWRRSLLLPLQSLFNPFGLFGSRQLVIPVSGWTQFGLGLFGLAGDALILMIVLGIRRRFKVG